MSANQPQTPVQLPQAPPTPPPAVAAAAIPPRRSPGVAAILACFPGLGHLYLGLYQRGIAFFLSFATAIWFTSHSNGELGILIAFVWFFNVIDAYRQASLFNQYDTTGTLPAPMKLPKSAGSLGFGVFLTLLGALLLYNQFYPLDLTFLVDWWPMILVLAGLYLLARHFIEQKKQREAMSSPDSI
jgi:hypothetical protein